MAKKKPVKKKKPAAKKKAGAKKRPAKKTVRKKAAAKKKSKKPSKLEYDLRVHEIYGLTLMGYKHADIVNYCKKKWRITSSRSVWKLERAAKERLLEQTIPEEREARRKQLARYGQVLKKADEAGDFNLAVRTLARIDKILGLEISRHELTGFGGGPLEIQDLTDDKLDERIRQLERELGITGTKRKTTRTPVA